MINLRRTPPPALVIGAGILVGTALILLFNAPRVERFTPISRSDGVSSLSRIEITFNRPMNTLSVESRLQIEPEQSGQIFWDEVTLIYVPDQPWPMDSEVRVTLSSGASGANRIPMLRQRTWIFEVGEPGLIYLWPADGKSELYQKSLETGDEPVRIIESETGLLEYSLSQDGSKLIYVSALPDGGTALHAFDMISREDRDLLACDSQAPCAAPALSHDGAWLAFERTEYSLGAADRLLATGTSIWLLDLNSERPPTQISPADHIARNPGWSPTGWLVYYDDRLKALALVNPEDPTPFNYLPTSLGILGSWAPDGTELVYPDIIFPEEAGQDQEPSDPGTPLYFSHLYRVDVTDGRTLDISPGGEWMVEDASPSISPDGRWIAFTRKYLDPDRWSPGRQVWLMNREGTELKPLTDEPGVTFSSLGWSPNSERLVFMRKNLSDLGSPSEIWWIEILTGETAPVIEGAFLPKWLP